VKTRRLLSDVLRELKALKLMFSVCQNRHIKIKVTNPVTAQSASLVMPVSPAGSNYLNYFWTQYKEHMREIGIQDEQKIIKRKSK